MKKDFLPTTSLEIILGAILVFTGSIAMGFLIGAFAELLTEFDKSSKKHLQKFDELKEYLFTLKMPD